MNFFTIIEREASSRKLPYLVIGGYAVIAHGYPRLTFDFDLAVERTKEAAWLECAAALGYTTKQHHGSFLQLVSACEQWPLDLMLLNEQTFSKMFQSSESRRVGESAGGGVARVPCVAHLIALKVHALHHGHAGRFLKDFEDVIELVQRNKIDLSGAEMQETFRRYGTPELHDKIRRRCEGE